MNSTKRPYDPRITPARWDLAAAHLEGEVEAARFVEGTRKRVAAGVAPVHYTPRTDAPLATQALHGEIFVVYETNSDGWAWGQLELDQYVGWIPGSHLSAPGEPPTHRVAALRTFVYPGPDIKLRPHGALSLGARVVVEEIEGDFAVTDTGGYVYADHLVLMDYYEPEFIRTARRYLGVPYLWGGRTSLGIDCSGLVQISLLSAGIPCPRDSDMQSSIGMSVAISNDPEDLQTGDLICWRGHIGIVSAPGRLLHANAFHMQVAEESLAGAIARFREQGVHVVAVQRVPSIYSYDQ